MAHEHHHHHPALTYDQTTGRNFILGIVLNLAFVLVEAGAGLWLGSLALLSDAGHNLSDVFSLLLALLAFRMMRIQPSQKYTYGYKRMTILVSLVNALLLFVAVAAILWSSVEKILHPSPVQGDVVAWVAGIGILVNAFTAYLFFKGKDHDLNVKGAYLHMAADTLVSVGVLIAGVVIQLTGWYIVDPLIGIVVGVVILFSSWGLLRDSMTLTLDGVPRGIDPKKVKQTMLDQKGVIGVHHLHIWALSTTENALTAHVVVDDLAEEKEIKHAVKDALTGVGIQHATLELEKSGECAEQSHDIYCND
ncbi:MAG TPA: cation diffusion facilitator family transporter [Bacteroidetes bacterium]|nr:cation diffusion facilitator family transporter [Bacteroidota bacterium]